jgi:hypothetical protein
MTDLPKTTRKSFHSPSQQFDKQPVFWDKSPQMEFMI